MSTRQRVLVTGASKGIGRATLARLREDGYDAIGLARTRPADLADDPAFHCCDLNDLAQTRALVSALAAQGPFYALVNNAAMAPTTSVDDASLADMDDAMRINVNAALVCAQVLLPGMRAQGSGRIVNLSSRAALGKVNRTAYSASKAAVIGMSRTWALELAASGITVNVIAPGPIATELFRTASPPDDPKTRALMAAVPLQRVGAPEEIAHAVAFLLDARSGFMTGQTLHIDGGLTVSAVRL
ncbi:SDR family oxidoreductase [Cupriavidus taiwanensis]|uniref:SDR family oxidoreductase n=1 Tax=Cupriavidus taiwanensis TaxID=164546 RepID=UPI0015726118|nr:SDR family oxidoreductase [Cupriavidus taiwanensis]NSX12975.1 SDR family oxidoreductase [Cupriavidus taiwanensis]